MGGSRSWSRSRSPTMDRRLRTRSRSSSEDRRDQARPHSQVMERDNTRDNPDKSKCIGVFGLSLYTTEQDLKKEFEKFGPLEKCKLIVDAFSGRSKGFAFVYFISIEDACAAREALNGIEMDRRKIRVDFSITRSGHPPIRRMRMEREGRYDRRSTPPHRYVNEQYEGSGRWDNIGQRSVCPVYHRCGCYSDRGYKTGYYY